MSKLLKNKRFFLVLRQSIPLLVCFILTPLLSNCGMQKDDFFNCPEIKKDQQGSFMVPIHTQETIQVHLDPRFTAEEQDLISQATAQWNGVSQASIKRSFFKIQIPSEKNLTSLAITSKEACALPLGDEGSFQILKEESMTRWIELGFKENIPGVTLRCHTHNQLIKQVIFLNPSPVLLKSNQFMSIVLHELGHSLGLNHSCSESKGAENYRFCQELNPEHPYQRAVLFPTLGQSEVKNHLLSNDKERINCLYKEQP